MRVEVVSYEYKGGSISIENRIGSSTVTLQRYGESLCPACDRKDALTTFCNGAKRINKEFTDHNAIDGEVAKYYQIYFPHMHRTCINCQFVRYEMCLVDNPKPVVE